MGSHSCFTQEAKVSVSMLKSNRPTVSHCFPIMNTKTTLSFHKITICPGHIRRKSIFYQCK